MIDLGVARSDEVPQLAALLAELFSHEADFAPDQAKQTRALKAILSDGSRGTVFVARDAGVVVAMASLIYTISTAEGGPAALFEDLIVLPSHRGRGIATALIGFVMAQAKEKGLLRLTLLTDARNERAQALYRKLGFTDSAMKPMRLKL